MKPFVKQLLLFLRQLFLYLFQTFRFYCCTFFLKNRSLENLNLFERKIYSQNGEDGIIEIIFKKIGTINKFFVEIGTEDGSECNTRLLRKKGFSGLWIDRDSYQNPLIKKHFVTKENVEKIFNKYEVPKNFDLLSIDIDGNDYWIWKAIENYCPRVVIVEYNGHFPPPISKTISYQINFKYDKTNYFGATLAALNKIAIKKGYHLIACDNRGVNAFFIKKSLIKDNFVVQPIEKLYHPLAYGKMKNFKFIGYPQSPKIKQMVEV